MPYISRDNDRRERLRNGETAWEAGELNYQIFYYMKHNLADSDNYKYGQIKIYVMNFLGEKPNYQRYNDMTGCLVRCSRELKRRLGINAEVLIRIMNHYDVEIAKYEDIKINSNGDVE